MCHTAGNGVQIYWSSLSQIWQERPGQFAYHSEQPFLLTRSASLNIIFYMCQEMGKIGRSAIGCRTADFDLKDLWADAIN